MDPIIEAVPSRNPNIERFKIKITSKYSPEEILKISKISLKRYFIKRKNLEAAKVWELRKKCLNSKTYYDIAARQAFRDQKLVPFIYNFNKYIGILCVYYFIPGWFLLGFIRIITNKYLLNLTIQKLELKIYFHRLLNHTKIRTIEIDRGFIISLIPFSLSVIQYILAKYQPHRNLRILEYQLPIFSSPIQTLKWETIMLSNDAQQILLKEQNKLEISNDFLIIHRNKGLNLFGNIRWRDYIWASGPEANKNQAETILNLDELPKKLDGARAITYEYPEIENFIKFIESKVPLEFKENYISKRKLYQNRVNFNYLIRAYYKNSNMNFEVRELTKILKELNYSELIEPGRTQFDFEEEILTKEPQNLETESIHDFADLTDFQKFENQLNEQTNPIEEEFFDPLDYNFFEENFETNLDILPDNLIGKEKVDARNSLAKTQIKSAISKNRKPRNFIDDEGIDDWGEAGGSILDEAEKKFYNFYATNLSKLEQSSYNKKSDSLYNPFFFDEINIELDFIENPKLYSTLNEFFNKYKNLFIKYAVEEEEGNLEVFITPRKMSGYEYPDSKPDDIKWLLLKNFLFKNEKQSTLRIELPLNFAYTKIYPLKYPNINPENLVVATGVMDLGINFKNKKPTRSTDEVFLINHLKTPFFVNLPREDMIATELALPEILRDNYEGPAVLINENNDIRVLYTADNTKPFISNPKDDVPIINVPLNYFFGLSNNLSKIQDKTSLINSDNNTAILSKNNPAGIIIGNNISVNSNENLDNEPNILRSWVTNYYSPDNPILPKKVVYYKKDPTEMLNKHDLLDAVEGFRFMDKLEPQRKHYTVRISKEPENKKWRYFPYLQDYYKGRARKFSALPSKAASVIVAMTPESWEERYITQKTLDPFWRKLSHNKTVLRTDNTLYERKRALSQLMGFAVTALPTTQIYGPISNTIPKLKFGLANELDYNYSPFAASLFHKIYSEHNNPYTPGLFNLADFGNYTPGIYKDSSFINQVSPNTQNIDSGADIWEPLTRNSWLLISQISFGYIFCLLIKESAYNYGRELLSYLIDTLNETGYLPPDLQQELKRLMGEKETGFRVAKNFTKGFKDVIGIESLRGDLLETMFYLRGCVTHPAIAKNVQSLLLVGPPGTGKTLLVQALAYEAKVPVLTLTAVGSQEPAALERLFEEARRLAPCIVFMDEVDTIAARRSGLTDRSEFLAVIYNQSAGRSLTDDIVPEMSTIIGDVHPRILQDKEAFHTIVNRDVQNYLIKKNETEFYRVGLLLKLLTELDGIHSRDGIVIIGATNRVDVLDPALLRPGRFNRKVRVNLPNKRKRLRLFRYYSAIIGRDPNIPWDYLANLTYGFSAADISTIMNESSIKAIAKASYHTLETIEYGIDRITTTLVAHSVSKDTETGKNKKDFSFFTVRSAYYQAGKVLLGTLLKYHPPVIVAHLWYRENSVRYNQIQHTLQVEWLRYVHRGELEHRIIGAYGGKAGEFIFLENQGDFVSDLNISNMGGQDWAIGQALIQLLISKWHLYAPIALIQELLPIRSHFNASEYTEVRDHYMYEFSRTYEKTPTATNLLGGQNPQTRFPQGWWQMKVYQQYLSLKMQKWYSIWLAIPEEWRNNPHWIPPDKTYHQNPTEDNVSLDNAKLKNLAGAVRDYQIHSMVMESFNLAFSVLTEYRELLDQLAYELLHNEILREHTIHEIFDRFGLDCKNLKEDLNSSITMNELPTDFKILEPSWGVESGKPTIRWIDIEEITGNTTN
uniref:Cell division protein FtsH n=1 Tax=Prototheca wickerhamii TaxID=3111 RepID=A0A067Z0Y0_PROWI|nr:cell division protein FtsH [Prototheca wickerhamii]